MSSDLKNQLDQAVAFIKSRSSLKTSVGITLGSGLSSFADRLQNPVKIKFSEIPHFSPPTVEGHGGHLVLGHLGETALAVLQGRIHYYEGHDLNHVVFPTRVLAQLGVKTLLLTNASGGLDSTMQPGDFMVLKDHINLLGANPLRGPNPEFLGPRFPDMSEPYDGKLRRYLKDALEKNQARFSEGVYAGVAGPCYETAAEVRFLQVIGANAVGMSTVAETIAARHAGMKVAALACITNLATGLSSMQITHDEVKEIAKLSEAKFTATLSDFISRLALA